MIGVSTTRRGASMSLAAGLGRALAVHMIDPEVLLFIKEETHVPHDPSPAAGRPAGRRGGRTDGPEPEEENRPGAGSQRPEGPDLRLLQAGKGRKAAALLLQ